MIESRASKYALPVLAIVWVTAYVFDSMASRDWATGILLMVVILLGIISLRFYPVGRISAELPVMADQRVFPVFGLVAVLAFVTLISSRYGFGDWAGLAFMYLPMILPFAVSLRKGGVLTRLRNHIWSTEIQAGIIAGLPVAFVYLWPLGGRYLNLRLLLVLVLGVLFALLSSALPEEAFFRGFIQSRLERAYSPVLGFVWAALFFGLYHFPFALWSTGWPTYGKPLEALAYVLDQKLAIGVLFGYAFFRTRSLRSAIACHTVVNMGWLLSKSMF